MTRQELASDLNVRWLAIGYLERGEPMSAQLNGTDANGGQP